MTVPEVRRLLWAWMGARQWTEELEFALGWSEWRRRHQARARRCHSRRRVRESNQHDRRSSYVRL